MKWWDWMPWSSFFLNVEFSASFYILLFTPFEKKKKFLNMTYHINILKNKNHMIISVEENTFDKIRDPFIVF